MKKLSPGHFIIIGLLLLIGVWRLFESGILKKTINDDQTVWVYIELVVDMPNDTSSYYYYGQINESVFTQINNNPQSNGLFILSDIRFWNDDDLLEVYENEDYIGKRVFHIQDIRQIRAYKKDPIYVYKPEELHFSARSLRVEADTVTN